MLIDDSSCHNPFSGLWFCYSFSKEDDDDDDEDNPQNDFNYNPHE